MLLHMHIEKLGGGGGRAPDRLVTGGGANGCGGGGIVGQVLLVKCNGRRADHPGPFITLLRS